MSDHPEPLITRREAEAQALTSRQEAFAEAADVAGDVAHFYRYRYGGSAEECRQYSAVAETVEIRIRAMIDQDKQTGV